MNDLLAALGPVVDVMERLGVAYQLGGSVASSVYGMARATMDIDLVADVAPEHVDRFVTALTPAYYIDGDMMHEAIRERSSFNLIHQASMFKVDVFVPKARSYDREALSRRVADRLEDAPGAREFFVATPEDVVLAKLEWFERGDRTSERQWNDILGVLRVQGDAIDFTYLRQWAAELGLEELLERALSSR